MMMVALCLLAIPCLLSALTGIWAHDIWCERDYPKDFLLYFQSQGLVDFWYLSLALMTAAVPLAMLRRRSLDMLCMLPVRRGALQFGWIAAAVRGMLLWWLLAVGGVLLLFAKFRGFFLVEWQVTPLTGSEIFAVDPLFCLLWPQNLSQLLGLLCLLLSAIPLVVCAAFLLARRWGGAILVAAVWCIGYLSVTVNINSDSRQPLFRSAFLLFAVLSALSGELLLRRGWTYERRRHA